jgi:hypothetical protein
MTPTTTPRQVYETLIDRFAEFRRQVRARLLLEGAARFVAALVILALLSFILDRIFRLSLSARIAMVVASVITLAVVLWREVIAPLRLKLDPLTLATALDRISGRGDGFITSRVGTILELPAMLRMNPPPSPALLHQAAAACHAALVDIDFDSRLDDRRRNLASGILFIMVLIPVILAMAAPVSTRLWAARVLGGSNEPWPQKTYLQVTGAENGIIVVPRGEPYVLRAQATPGSLVIPPVVSIRFHEAGAARVEANFSSFGKNDFRYEFTSVNSPIEAELTGGDATLGPITLQPADRPRITDLKLIARHPTEKNPTAYVLNGETDLSFLPRTHLRLEFTASAPILEAHLKSTAKEPSPDDLKQLDATHFAVDWTHNAADNLEINLVSRDAHLSAAPTLVSVGLKTDQPPTVKLTYAQVKLRVTSKARIPLTIDPHDDFGLASTALLVKTETPDPEKPGKMITHSTSTMLYGPADPAIELDHLTKRTLELEPLKLTPGSLVTVSASATDACYTGPQTTTSRAVTFRVVAPEELFREILMRQQAERARFRLQADEVHAMRGSMNLAHDAESILKIAQRQRAVQHEVNRISTALAETLAEMKANQLGTQEAYDLMDKQVLTPMKQLNTELLNPQKEALDNLQPADTAGMAGIESRQEETFTRMTQILHQMSQWDSFVDVLNQLNEVIKLQDAAEQRTKALKKKQNDDLFDK